MKNRIVELCTLLCLIFSSCEKQKEKGVVIENVNIIPIWQDTILKKHDIKIVSGRILHIGKNISTHPKDTIIDGSSGYILPGLWDMHTHLPNKKKNGFGYEQYLALNFLSGVTNIRNMRGFDSISNLTNKIKNKRILSPNIHFTPPPISKKTHPPIDSIYFYMKKYKKESFKYWKILSLPNKSYFDTLVKYARHNQLKLVGHIPKHVGIKESITSGYSCIEHLQGYNGLFSDSLAFDNILELTKKNGVFNCATLDWYYITYLQYPLDEIYSRNHLKYIPKKTIKEWKNNISVYLEEIRTLGKDSLRSLIVADSVYIANKNIILKRLFDSNCKLLISPDANGMFQVPGFSMIDEMKLYEKTGIPKYNILKMATLNAAEWMNKTNMGFIKEGAVADFVLYGKNPLEDLNNLKKIKGIYFKKDWFDEKSVNNYLKKLEK